MPDTLDLPEGLGLRLVDSSGVVFAVLRNGAGFGPISRSEQKEMVEEALRWGDPCYRWCDDENIAIALPLTWNQTLLGGLLALVPSSLTSNGQGNGASPPREIAQRLMDFLGQCNWLNLALMADHRAAAERERLRAEAIHEAKTRGEGPWQASYSYWEPELFLAMRRRERSEARRILNRILLALYSLGMEDLGRTKGFVLDLVTMMARTMVDCGADPADTLGRGMERLNQLDALEDEETLGRWVADILERLIDAVEKTTCPSEDFRMSLALKYLREHCEQPLSRDEVAAKVGLSPAHFSRLFSAAVGRSFSDELLHIRLEKAIRLLGRSDAPIKEIAGLCGFSDQGYFTRVFRRKLGRTPGAYAALSPHRTKVLQTERMSQ
ncbi:MAG: helix-turn-helix transcriptional regulator [Opitutales bacterium]|nr:helix-turn-helix transcriptional regulator [Opitutales bacterium]